MAKKEMKNTCPESFLHYLESANRAEGRTFEFESMEILQLAQDPDRTQKEKLDAMMCYLRKFILNS